MLDYRIYWLDANGHIVRADNLVAADDAEARGKAEALLGWHQRSLSLDQHAPVQAGNLLHHCEVQTLGAG